MSAKAASGSASSGATAMSPSRRSPAQPATCSASGEQVRQRGTPPRCRVAVHAVLHSTGSGPARPPVVQARAGGGVERVGQADGVDGLHLVAPSATTARGLVALQAADEVPARVGPRGRRAATSATLRAASCTRFSPNRVEPEVEQRGDVGGRHGLGDGHERDLVGVAPGRGAGGRDPLAGRPRAGRPAPRVAPPTPPRPRRAPPMARESARFAARVRTSGRRGNRELSAGKRCRLASAQNVPTRGGANETADSRGHAAETVDCERQEGSSQVTAARRPVRPSRRWL